MQQCAVESQTVTVRFPKEFKEGIFYRGASLLQSPVFSGLILSLVDPAQLAASVRSHICASNVHCGKYLLRKLHFIVKKKKISVWWLKK